jgi:hypothetical protein
MKLYSQKKGFQNSGKKNNKIDMKLCPNCKTELLDKAKFCSSFGENVANIQAEDADL